MARPKRSPNAGDSQPQPTPTIRDVARAAGVAVSTVSRALANEPRVAPGTRRRISAIAQELGYAPNRFARSMRSANMRTIGYVAPELENPIANDHLRAAIRAAFAVGYTLLVADGQGSAEILEGELNRLREYRVDGLLLGRGVLPVTDALIGFVRRNIPVEPCPWTLDALIAARGSVLAPYGERGELERSAATIAYRAIIAAGNRRVAYFSRPGPITQLADARLQALNAAIAEIGASAEIEVIRTDPVDCVAEVQRLATLWQPPLAIVCANGLLTPHLLEGIRSVRLCIPDDVSFLCYGDSAWHRAFSPPLSVIRHDYAAAAQRSVERVVARIEGRDIPDVPRRPSEFVDRASIGRGR